MVDTLPVGTGDSWVRGLNSLGTARSGGELGERIDVMFLLCLRKCQMPGFSV